MTEQWDIREEKLYTRLLWLSIIASILIFFWGIWSIPFLSHNEGRRGQAVEGSPSLFLVEERKDYIRKRRTARLYGTLGFCPGKSTVVSKTTNEQTK